MKTEDENMTEKERKDARMAVLYEIRLLIEEEEEIDKEKMLKLIDTIAKAKNAE